MYSFLEKFNLLPPRCFAAINQPTSQPQPQPSNNAMQKQKTRRINRKILKSRLASIHSWTICFCLLVHISSKAKACFFYQPIWMKYASSGRSPKIHLYVITYSEASSYKWICFLIAGHNIFDQFQSKIYSSCSIQGVWVSQVLDSTHRCSLRWSRLLIDPCETLS